MDRRTIGKDGGHRGELLFKSCSLASNQNPRSVAGAEVVCSSQHREQNQCEGRLCREQKQQEI